MRLLMRFYELAFFQVSILQSDKIQNLLQRQQQVRAVCSFACDLWVEISSSDTSDSAGGGERVVERGGGGAAAFAVLGLAK